MPARAHTHLWLDVPVRDSFFMQVLESFANLQHVEPCIAWAAANVGLHRIKQLATGQELRGGAEEFG